MKNIIQIETIVRVIFGELDAEGVVINKQSVDYNCLKLTQEVLDGLKKAVAETKDKLSNT